MKLIQKHLFRGTHEFELLEDSVVVHIKTPFKEQKLSIPLANLDPKPAINKAKAILSFNSRDKSGPVLSLYLNKPDSEKFEVFVNAIQEHALRLNNKSAGKESVIKAYSQRLTPPFSGLVQIAESERARALTMDGKTWEFQYLHIMLDSESTPGKNYRRRFSHALTVDKTGLEKIVSPSPGTSPNLDESLVELADFISNADFPFPSTDIYEYWLLDHEDESPLAMIFSCSEAEQMSTFPNKTEWTALPAAAMPIELTPVEKERHARPVNIRVEEMVSERAGFFNSKARWFKRHPDETESFPPLLLKEEWQDENQADLCQRYLLRQSSRLLMLHGLTKADRQRLESAARPHVMEVDRFYPFYPEIIDQKMMNAILVEARLRKNTEATDHRSVHNRRDGVLYL